MRGERPTMLVLAGPNGAGKTSLHTAVIGPRFDAPFINADLIQRDELRDPGMQAAYRAADMAQQRRREHLALRLSFATESTFSHPSKLQLVDDARQAGYRVVLYHVNVGNPELLVHRVGFRVAQGGHNVPEHKIRERYERSQPLIRQAALRSDHAFVYDNSILGRAPSMLLVFRRGAVVRAAAQLPAWAASLYAPDIRSFSEQPLDPGAESLFDAGRLASRHAGRAVNITLPETGRLYRGPVVGKTAMHYVQASDNGVYVAHFRTTVGLLQLQWPYAIRMTGAARAQVSMLAGR